MYAEYKTGYASALADLFFNGRRLRLRRIVNGLRLRLRLSVIYRLLNRLRRLYRLLNDRLPSFLTGATGAG